MIKKSWHENHSVQPNQTNNLNKYYYSGTKKKEIGTETLEQKFSIGTNIKIYYNGTNFRICYLNLFCI